MKLNLIKTIWLPAFLFLTFGLVFQACNQEDSLLNNSDWNRPLSSKVLEAKIWFDKKSNSSIKPIWQLAKVEGNIVEIPIEVDGQFQIPSLKQDKVVFGKQRLYFVKSSNSSGGAIVNFLPLAQFKGRVKDISILNYRNLSFSGLVIVKDLNDNFLRGIHCENGHFVSKIIQKKITEGQLNTRGDCHWGEELYACGSVCSGGACGEPQCSSRDTYTCTYSDPDPNPNPDPCADGSCDNGCPMGICDDGNGPDSGGSDDGEDDQNQPITQPCLSFGEITNNGNWRFKDASIRSLTIQGINLEDCSITLTISNMTSTAMTNAQIQGFSNSAVRTATSNIVQNTTAAGFAGMWAREFRDLANRNGFNGHQLTISPNQQLPFGRGVAATNCN